MKDKLKVAPATPPSIAKEPQEPVAYAMPVALFNQIVQFIGQAGYFQVEGLMNAIKTQSQPLFPQNIKSNEAQNQTTPDE